MEGLRGLVSNTNRRESAMREVGVLEQMSKNIEQDRNQEIQAQQAQNEMFERMYQTADNMLEKDRIKINKRIALAQGQLRNQLSDFGGSKKDFMANGGLSALNKISNDIIRSDEAVRYQSNKENLAKILEAQEKGLGHLLAPNDLESLKAYQENEEGAAITYSGMMAEVEIPPAQNFDYGTEIPINNILSYKGNLIKIMGNYYKANPDAPKLDPRNNPNDYAKIVAFVKKMGYGGTGSNTTRMREQAAQAKARAAYEAKRNTKTDAKKSVINEFTRLMSEVPADLNISKLNEEYSGSFIEAKKKIDPAFRMFTGEKSTIMSRQRGLDEKGFDGNDLLPDWIDEGGAYLFNDKVGLKDSYHIFEGNQNAIVNRVMGEKGKGLKIENGKVLNWHPSGQGVYRMDGVKINEGNEPLEEDFRGNYKVRGITTAMKSSMASDGSEALLINAYNDDGTLDEDATEKINKGYGNGNMKMTTVIALENENGDVFYQEVDMSSPDIKTLLSNEMAEDDDMTETIKSEQQSAEALNNISKNTKEEEILFEGTRNKLDESVFSDEIFKLEGENYYGAQSAGQQNRYPMMKSFYMAFDYIRNSSNNDASIYEESIQQAVDSNLFSAAMVQGDLEEDLKNYSQGNSPDKMILKWLENVNSDLKEGSAAYEKNRQLASKWKQILGLVQ